MEINNLKAFLAVTESNSFSQAAEKLHLTQPAISKRIAALEESLDTRLFDRISRRIQLTEAGNILLPTARSICGDIQQVQQAIASIGKSVGGRLSIGTSHHIGLHRLPEVLREFTSSYPQVELDLHFMDSEDACIKVENNQLELAIVTLPETPFPQLNSEIIWRDPLQISCARNHPLGALKHVTATDLATYPAIVPSPETVTRQILDKALLPYDVRLKIAMETNYIETIKMMVSVGLGWSSLPQTMLNEELLSIPVKGLTLERRLGTATHKKRSLSTAAEAFITLLRNHSSL